MSGGGRGQGQTNGWGSVQRGSVQRGSVQRGSVQRGSVQRGSVQRGRGLEQVFFWGGLFSLIYLCPLGGLWGWGLEALKPLPPWGAGGWGLGSPETFCPLWGLGGWGLEALKPFAPWGAGGLGAGSPETFCPLGGLGGWGLEALKPFAPWGAGGLGALALAGGCLKTQGGGAGWRMRWRLQGWRRGLTASFGAGGAVAQGVQGNFFFGRAGWRRREARRKNAKSPRDQTTPDEQTAAQRKM